MEQEPALPRHERTGLGLRVQILFALGGVILLAYLPLFFAIAQVTRANSLAYREESARALGRAVAAHASDLTGQEPAAIASRLDAHVGEGGALAIAVFGATGEVEASAGPEAEVRALHAPARPYGEAATRVATSSGSRALDVVLPAGTRAVLVRVRTDEDAARSRDVVRGIALYMGVFALALLVVAYSLLTRAIVKPIELLGRAADRVASGARSLELPTSGAREIADLGASVRSMASRLLRDEETLRAKVEELTTTTRRLGETREQLAGSERLASVGRLAAGVAHEIGNPIAAIMGMHDLIEDDGTPADERADFLRRMRKETERINVVVRDLLDFARPEAPPDSARLPVPSSANLSEVVNDVLALVRPQKDWRGIDVTVDVDAGLTVALSAQRLTQVLLNLLLNAAASLAAAPEAGPRHVRIRGRAGPMIRLEVEDTGAGIASAVADRIFDPFVTTKDVGSGTGLGLAVCRGIVEGAGGKIQVDETYTNGARFLIDLPSASSSPG
ncbi:MAG: Sensor histidine kinase [Labilithrix sp.]|nr:Sensor histidine kinase [Labilithrix sp.]